MWRHRIRNNRGSALVELALTLPLLSLIMIGGIELGRVAYFAIELTNAARAGAALGAQNPAEPGYTSAIEDAAQADAPDITLTWNTAPAVACTCETIYDSSTQAPTYSPSKPGSCAAVTTCASVSSTQFSQVVEYIVVQPQATVKTIFKYPGIPTSFTLNGSAQLRVFPQYE